MHARHTRKWRACSWHSVTFIPKSLTFKSQLQGPSRYSHVSKNERTAEVNKEEAKHRTVFVAGWRPFTGWVCASALAYHFILEPVLVFFLTLYGINIDLPQFDMGSLLTVLMGMLGLGSLRTYEKTQGLTK